MVKMKMKNQFFRCPILPANLAPTPVSARMSKGDLHRGNSTDPL